ncbi:helix-turn-helix transcriptional regulator [Enterococcus rivorum]|uniref:DNA-binding transcriptional regulator n=1 Tax=Enterococcus rivorum TaxID=762845 RepID=A0A1E5KVT8_9ENTE|nr:YafY family protein [Enterococcus rivorum]MBP2100339.1 putative DNA-binding transcriptional regulator YafY [Enterococcus rivorum]OEH81749.1 hypothetical protein BCR26_15660 [Enterococcus rivorum]
MRKEQILYSMIWYIQSKKEFTAQELADEFKVSVRSIYRYITDLAELGVYVESKKGRNGGFRVLPNQVLPSIMFTKDELFSLYFAIESLTEYKDFPFKLNGTAAKEKLLSVVPIELRQKLEKFSDHFQLSTPKQAVSSLYLNDLIKATLEGVVIKIDYQSKQQQSEKIVEPIGIYASNGYWYFVAFDKRIQEARHYRVDRIKQLTMMEEQVETVRVLEPEIYSPRKKVDLFVELTKKGVQQCRENRYVHSYVQETKEGLGVLSMIIDEADIPFTTDFFLLLGKEAKVREPQVMVAKLKEKANELLAQYSD